MKSNLRDSFYLFFHSKSGFSLFEKEGSGEICGLNDFVFKKSP